MKDLKKTCRVAVVQAAPVMFDKAACVQKAVELIKEAGAHGAELIVFPELFIPCYPYGLTFGFTVGSRKEPGRADWKLYYDNSVLVPGPETALLAAAAREAGAGCRLLQEWLRQNHTKRPLLHLNNGICRVSRTRAELCRR